MKRAIHHGSWLVIWVIAAACWLGFSSNASAADDEPSRKLGRGTTNLFMCWLEIPKSWQEIRTESGEFAGITWGTYRGISRTVMRAGVGVYEIVTFPYANGAIIYPEWIFSREEEAPWRIRQKDDIY